MEVVQMFRSLTELSQHFLVIPIAGESGESSIDNTNTERTHKLPVQLILQFTRTPRQRNHSNQAECAGATQLSPIIVTASLCVPATNWPLTIQGCCRPIRGMLVTDRTEQNKIIHILLYPTDMWSTFSIGVFYLESLYKLIPKSSSLRIYHVGTEETNTSCQNAALWGKPHLRILLSQQ